LTTAHFTVHATTGDYTILSRGRLVCLIAHTEMGPAAWQAVTRIVASVAGASSDRVQSLTLLEEFPLTARADTRAETETYARTVGRFLSRSAVVIEGGGLRATFVRSIIAGMSVLSRSAFPRRVFGNLTDASYWLNEGMKREIDPATFLDALEQARHEVGRQVA
jgi:hypothetical protein